MGTAPAPHHLRPEVSPNSQIHRRGHCGRFRRAWTRPRGTRLPRPGSRRIEVTDNAAGGGSGASETRGGAVPLVCGGDFRNRCHKRGSMESRALRSTFVKDKGKRHMIQKEKPLKIMCHEKRRCLPRPRPLPAPRIRARSLIPNPSSKSLFVLHRLRGAT